MDRRKEGVRPSRNFLVFLGEFANCEKRLLASSCMPVCLSVRMEQLGSQWADFHDT